MLKRVKHFLTRVIRRPSFEVSPNEGFRLSWIEDKLRSIPAGKSLLDAGAGELRWKKTCAHLNYVSQDFCEYKGGNNAPNSGLQMDEWDTSGIDIVSDIIEIPVDNDSFDYILCSEVLEHIKRPDLAITEFARILRPGGRLILTAPFCSLTHMAPYHFSTGFNQYWYKEILKDNGFLIEEITPNGNYFSYMAQELSRLMYVINRYGSNDNKQKIEKYSYRLSRELKKYNHVINQSSELLCFGYNIVAVRK